MSAEPGLWDKEVALGQESDSKPEKTQSFCPETSLELLKVFQISLSLFSDIIPCSIWYISLDFCHIWIDPGWASKLNINLAWPLFRAVVMFKKFYFEGHLLTLQCLLESMQRNAQWLKFTGGFEPYHPSHHSWAGILAYMAKHWSDSVQTFKLKKYYRIGLTLLKTYRKSQCIYLCDLHDQS